MKNLANKVLTGIKRAGLILGTAAALSLPFQKLSASETDGFSAEQDKKTLEMVQYMNQPGYWDMQHVEIPDFSASSSLAKTMESPDWYYDAVVNTFLQPRNIIVTSIPYRVPNFYGNADADSSGDVNWADHAAMLAGEKNERTDVTGDGKTDSLDAQLLADYLTSGTPLPSWLRFLQSPEVKTAWANYMLELDQTNTIPYHDGTPEERWISGNYATQLVLNFFGYWGGDIPTKYDTTGIGRVNWPVYRVILSDSLGIGHGMNAIFIGTDPRNFDRWLFMDPAIDAIGGGETFRDNIKGKFVSIMGIDQFNLVSSPDMPRSIPILGFSIDNLAQASVIYQNQDLILTKPGLPPIARQLSQSMLEETVLNISKDSLAYNHNDSLSYSILDHTSNINAEFTDTSLAVTGLENYFGPADLAYIVSKGELSDTGRVLINIENDPDFPVAVTRKDTTVTTKDPVNLDARQSYHPDSPVNEIVSYHWKRLSGPASEILDPDSNVAYFTPSDSGLYEFELMVRDSIGEEGRDTSRVHADIQAVPQDTTPPLIEITHPKSDTTYTSHVTNMRYNLFDENPDSSWYSTDGGLTKIAVPWSPDTTITGLRSKQGENIWIKYARDLAGNEASDTVRFNIALPDTIPPEISITYPENDSLYTSHVTGLEYIVSDENPDSMWYSIDNNPRIAVAWGEAITGLKSKQGTNTWYLYAKDTFGNASSDTAIFNVDTTTNIEDIVIPSTYSLKQNYPNPFNLSTIIEYTLPKTGPVSLDIYNMLGRELETLVNTTQPPGYYEVNFSAENLSSGVYFYRLSTEEFSKTRKMTILK